MKRRHPIQNTEYDAKVLRFARNEIVRLLLDEGPFNLNQLYVRFHRTHPEDYEQLMMLIGYSLSGFGDLCGNDPDEPTPCKYATLAAAERKRTLNSEPEDALPIANKNVS